MKALSERVCRTYSEAEQFYLSLTADETQSRIDSSPEDDDTMGLSVGLGVIESEPLSDTSSIPDETDSRFDPGGGDFGGAGAGQ